MGRLDGRVALVFGAGSSGPGWGNGKATAVTYARKGAHVVAIDVDLEAARETEQVIRAEGFAFATGASTSCTTTSASRRWADRSRRARKAGTACSTST